MTDSVELETVARTRRGCRADAQGVSHRRAPGPSYKESLIDTSCIDRTAMQEVEVETAVLREAKQRRATRFLKGPIPMQLIAAANRLPGCALAVMLAIHHQTTLTSKPFVGLPAKLMDELGISRHAKARALRVLELAGLVRVDRQLGRAAQVMLIGIPA